jgi:enolase-phosphatase E1
MNKEINIKNYEYLIFDIEGTITSIDFVKKILYPYSILKFESYIKETINEKQTQEDIKSLMDQNSVDAKENTVPIIKDTNDITGIVNYLKYLVNSDRKVSGLKSLQGRIWEIGYKNKEIEGDIFEDFYPVLLKLKECNKKIFIYSSGSVAAQKYLLQYSKFGDLTKYIQDYFDLNNIGMKNVKESYEKILKNFEENYSISFENVCFFTDSCFEADAASSTNIKVVLSSRGIKYSEKYENDFQIIDDYKQLLF